MMDRPVAMADAEAVGGCYRSADPGLGVADGGLQILAFREKVGAFGTLYYPCHDWVDPQLAKRSMELMAEQVMPKVNAALKE